MRSRPSPISRPRRVLYVLASVFGDFMRFFSQTDVLVISSLCGIRDLVYEREHTGERRVTSTNTLLFEFCLMQQQYRQTSVGINQTDKLFLNNKSDISLVLFGDGYVHTVFSMFSPKILIIILLFYYIYNSKQEILINYINVIRLKLYRV